MTVKSAQRIKGMMKNIEKDNNLDKRTDLMFKRAKLKRQKYRQLGQYSTPPKFQNL